MATVTGTLKDFRALSLGTTAELIFRPTNPAGTGTGSLLASREIRVIPDSAGAFTVDLVVTEEANPRTPYRLTILWLGPGAPITEEVPWLIVVPYGGGRLVDMFADVKPGSLITKGDKGDDGDVVQQEAIDALEAKDLIHDARLDVVEERVTTVDERVTELDVRIDTSNLGRDTDGVPFFHIGAMTLAILQDTDGNPYYKARS